MSTDAIHMDGSIAVLEGHNAVVYFSKGNSSAGQFVTTPDTGRSGTAPQVKQQQTLLKVAYWGEDNRFPQNIERQMATCGIARAGLDWKARALYGAGIVPGKITGVKDDGSEIFTPLDRAQHKAIYEFLEKRSMFRFLMEYFQDWVWFANCFPEVILSKDAKKIIGFVHQESADCRFKQVNDEGIIDTVYVSKLWGATADQYAKYDPEKRPQGLIENSTLPEKPDDKYFIAVDCIDMYDPVNSLKKIAEKLKEKEGNKSAILPVNYPSVNKTYYQVATWDGARMAGWVEISAKIPSLLKTLYNKAFRLKYHIEIPYTYFEMKYGTKVWNGFDEKKKAKCRKDLLKEINDYLQGEKNSFATLVSFFDVETHDKTEYGRIKITAIDDKINIDKELIITSAADVQILTAQGLHPTLIGAGTIGTGQQRTGGSDQREAQLIYNANLNLERQVLLEPFYLARDYNGWESDIVFRIRDTVLTTLDKNTGTEKKLS